MARVGFIHSAPGNVETFARELRRADAQVIALHIVDPGLLDDAGTFGADGPEVGRRLEAHIDELAADGAETIICSCSTVGAAAERIGRGAGVDVARVDRPLAEVAARCGGRVAVVATLPAALESTAGMIRERVDGRGEVIEVACPDAWEAFRTGDTARMTALVERAARAAARSADVVVLAQASIAQVAERLTDLGRPVLSAPAPAVAAALARIVH